MNIKLIIIYKISFQKAMGSCWCVPYLTCPRLTVECDVSLCYISSLFLYFVQRFSLHPLRSLLPSELFPWYCKSPNLFITLCFFRDYNRLTCLFIPDPLPNASLSGMNLHPRILFCFLTRFTSVSAWLLLISSFRDFVVVGVQLR